MVDESDRMARASKYVLGLMDEDERARAERDLEHNTAFRDAMIQVAERMHLFDLNRPDQSAAPALWKSITAHLGALPHIRIAEPSEAGSKSPPSVAAQGSASVTHGRKQHLGRGWRISLLTLSLLTACGIGYAAGSVGNASTSANCGSVVE